MKKETYYEQNFHKTVKNYASEDVLTRDVLINAVENMQIERVLDVGCGAGNSLIPFAEKKQAICVGIDIADELGNINNPNIEKLEHKNKIFFSRARSEQLPFADESFDVILCRVALPYTDNVKTISEFARVLRSKGVLLLKVHAPAFYFGLFWRRLKTFSPKQIAYPAICLTGSLWHQFTGRQLKDGFWEGKEIYQTRNFLTKEFEKNEMEIKGILPDTNIQTPSYIIEKK